MRYTKKKDVSFADIKNEFGIPDWREIWIALYDESGSLSCQDEACDNQPSLKEVVFETKLSIRHKY